MKKIVLLCLVAAISLFALQGQAKPKFKQAPIYIFGYALSPTDSTVYVTEIQRIDTAYIERNSKAMMARTMYSYQLQKFLSDTYGLKGAICNIFFSENRNKLDKKYDRVISRARNANDLQLCLMGAQVMRFTTVEWDETMYSEQIRPIIKKRPKKKK